MKNLYLIGVLAMFLFAQGMAQVAINNDNSQPDPAAMLDVKSSNKGFLTPRMNESQRNSILSPTIGLLVYQTDAPAGFYYFNGTVWMYMGTGEGQSLGSLGQGGGGHMIDADGNAYPTVKIGTQEWMAENLRVTHYRNGDLIPYVTSNATWTSTSAGAYCWYNNDPITYKIPYGALYNWPTVNDSRNLCPIGWHVASDDDWTALTTYLGGLSLAGGPMKTCVLWTSLNVGATNLSGFSGFPGGFRDDAGAYYFQGDMTYWWTSTATNSLSAWSRKLIYSSAYVSRVSEDNHTGFSVRCISTIPLTIGQSYQGGIIIYIDGTGEHGLIAATSDQSSAAQWGCYGNPIGNTYTAVGQGQFNTNWIVLGCLQSGIAARICDNLVLGGYSDWFLPSKDELNLMYKYRNIIGGFSNSSYCAYWSSSEFSAEFAWIQDFATGIHQYGYKNGTCFVRAMRAF